MRLIRHDVRDMKLAFGLAFDVTRISRAGFALAWTVGVFLGALTLLGWQMRTDQSHTGGLYEAWVLLFESPVSVTKVLVWLAILLAWWLGYAYLNAPVYRSAALDLARDECERNPHIPPLCRQATFAPLLGLLLPGMLFLCVLLWSLLSLIPGMFGAILTSVTVPLPLIAGLIGGAILLVVVLATPLMGPTAVVEGRDYFEVLSRPMSYVMQRPGAYFGYTLVKLGMLLVSAFAGALVLGIAWGMIAGALWLIGQGELVAGTWTAITSTEGVAGAPHALGLGLMFWASLAIFACWLSVVGSNCDVITYMLLRYKIDGVTFDKIAVVEERLRRLPNAEETAAQAEEARKRFDKSKAADDDKAEEEQSAGDGKKPEDAA